MYIIIEPDITEQSELDKVFDITNRKLRYSEYLKTSYWKRVREQCLIFFEYSCSFCNKHFKNDKSKLHVHHNNYDRLEQERIGRDIITLYRDCHMKIHDKSKSTDVHSYKRRKKIIHNDFL